MRKWQLIVYKPLKFVLVLRFTSMCLFPVQRKVKHFIVKLRLISSKTLDLCCAIGWWCQKMVQLIEKCPKLRCSLQTPCSLKSASFWVKWSQWALFVFAKRIKPAHVLMLRNLNARYQTIKYLVLRNAHFHQNSQRILCQMSMKRNQQTRITLWNVRVKPLACDAFMQQ